MSWRTNQHHAASIRRGFTLVELLVALGLVALLMLLFAQVFQVATGAMSTQRGIMENDQRARVLTTIITNDLKNRSAQTVMPFTPGETDYANAGYYSFNKRLGFVSISENDPNTDNDVLHFTTVLTDTSAEPFYGKATGLPVGAVNLLANPNQPDADDSLISSNNSGTSTTAEMVFFSRNKNLYRRVLLIRDPLDKPTMDRQPFDTSTNNYFDTTLMGTYAIGSDFWNDFDYSARNTSTGVRFLGSGSSAAGINPLDNSLAAGFFPIGIPLNRFGHDPDISNPNVGPDGMANTIDDSVGNPREYVGSLYIGRFTHEETSHANFNFPHSDSVFEIDSLPPTFAGNIGQVINDRNPMKFFNVATNALSDNNGNSVIDQYERGPRRGEDILMSNVYGFDVKVWDEVVGGYVDIGYSGATVGDFHQNNNLRTSYGPWLNASTSNANNRMFDTWHPAFDANNLGGVDANDMPPFAPVYNATNNAWVANASYKIGDVVVPLTSTGFAYKATNILSGGVSSNTGTSAGSEPTTWDTTVGNTTLDAIDVNNVITWTTIPLVKRLKSLKITIRYLDVSSDQMRQVTIIQSLMD